jgi:hypothetical protein
MLKSRFLLPNLRRDLRYNPLHKPLNQVAYTCNHHQLHSPSWYCSLYRGSIPCLFHPLRLRVSLRSLWTYSGRPYASVLRRPFAVGGTRPLGHTLYWFKALTISTHLDSQTLTKYIPFVSVFPFLKWNQVIRLSIFQGSPHASKKNFAHTHPSFPLQTVTSIHRLGLTRFYGTIRHLAAHRFSFPVQVIPPLPCPRSRQGDYEASLGHLHLLFHPS